MNPTELYWKVRETEGRVYPDALLARLPEVPANHPLSEEWQVRADSSVRLVRYLRLDSRPLKILEIGCGNGWFSARLAQLPGIFVVGLDRNLPELAQAARVFIPSNLVFVAADILFAPLAHGSFDLIMLASVIQYIPDLVAFLRSLLPLLTAGGEIHMLDSPLYRVEEIPAARERTRTYYRSIGFPEMADYYFHHPVSALTEFSPRWLYRPQGWQIRLARRFGRSVSPFPWICIRQESQICTFD